MNEPTYETIDLTEQEQIEEEPVVEPVQETEEEIIEETREEAEIGSAADEQDETAGEPEEPEAEPEIEPEYAQLFNDRFSALESRITALFERLETLAGVLDNINAIEESRAAGPQGFFKPVENGAPEKGELPYIERKYI